MSDSAGLGKLVPGFDFLQGLVKNAGAALPGLGQWIAPTLNPEELEKRIEELRTVQFWLEQNARMLAATIQALEVQRMTLSTLKTMNVSVDALRDSMTLRVPAPPQAPTTDAAAAAPKAAARSGAKAPKASGTKPGAAGVVDPMQWWGALTNQFTHLATQAMKDMVKDGATEGAKSLATQLVKQSFNAAEQTIKAGMAPVKKAAGAATAATGAAARAAGQAAGALAQTAGRVTAPPTRKAKAGPKGKARKGAARGPAGGS